MPRINEDGNLLGRVAALAILIGSTFYVSRLWCAHSCPLGESAKCCPLMRK